MHDDGQLARDGDSGALKADPLTQFKSPVAQFAFGLAAGEEHCRRLVKQPAQMVVASSGDMAVIVDLAGLIAPRRQPSQAPTERDV